MKQIELENRLIEFSVMTIKLADTISNKFAGIHLSKQLMRSGTSVSLNYGEVRGAESTKDFIHKMKIVLKELRESYNCLRIIEKSSLSNEENAIKNIIVENNELISIFVASLKTSQKKIQNS